MIYKVVAQVTLRNPHYYDGSGQTQQKPTFWVEACSEKEAILIGRLVVEAPTASSYSIDVMEDE